MAPDAGQKTLEKSGNRLARSAEHAIDLAVALSATGTCRSVRRAHGPVPGARLVGS